MVRKQSDFDQEPSIVECNFDKVNTGIKLKNTKKKEKTKTKSIQQNKIEQTKIKTNSRGVVFFSSQYF